MRQASEKTKTSNVGAPMVNPATVMVISTAVWALLLSVAVPANAQPATIKGMSGYLSEWEISGRADTVSLGQGRSLSGVVTMTHIGVCSQDGPVKKAAEFRATIVGVRPSARIEGIFVLEGAVCRFSGQFLSRFIGAMDCPSARAVPVAFTLE